MELRVTNTQHRCPVNMTQMARVARCAIRQLGIRTRGRLEVTFIDARRMRALNRRFMHHDRVTDVLSFRYEVPMRSTAEFPLRQHGRGAVVGEILIAPSQARAYAKRHGIPYTEELSRYVIHGLLHWLGEEDAAAAQQARMRRLEDQLLRQTVNGR